MPSDFHPASLRRQQRSQPPQAAHGRPQPTTPAPAIEAVSGEADPPRTATGPAHTGSTGEGPSFSGWYWASTEPGARSGPAGPLTFPAAHRDLVLDALEALGADVPARRPAVEAALRAVGEWHDHDPDEPCPDDCPTLSPLPGESMAQWGVRLGLRPGIGGQPIDAVGDGDDDPRLT